MFQNRESSSSSIQDLIKKNVEINQQFNECKKLLFIYFIFCFKILLIGFRPKGSYVTEYQESYHPHPSSHSPTVGRKKRLDITPVGTLNRGHPGTEFLILFLTFQ